MLNKVKDTVLNSSILNALQADVVQRAINVMSAPYNAKGDGVTDDTAAIQAADDVAYATLSSLIIPPGTFIHSGLTLRSKVFGSKGSVLKYNGSGTSITIPDWYTELSVLKITSTGLDTKLIQISASGYVGIIDCDITGGGIGIDISNATNSVNIERNSIHNNRSHGIYSKRIKRSTISNNFIFGNNGYGVYFDGFSHGALIGHNQLWGNLSGGIYIQGEQVGDAVFEYEGLVTKSQHCVIVGNHIDHNAEDAGTTYPTSYGIYLESAERTIISSNLIRYSRTYGLYATADCSYCTLTSNSFWKSGNPAGTVSFRIAGSRFNIIGNIYTEAMTLDNPADHTVIDTEGGTFIYGNMKVYDQYKFGGGTNAGYIKQASSGAGQGQINYNINATGTKKHIFENTAGSTEVVVSGKVLWLQDTSGVSRSISISNQKRILIDGSSNISKNNTAARPSGLTDTAVDIGYMYMDTTLSANGKPIWWNGTAWVDATGAIV